MAILRAIDLREGRRAFWAYLSRAVERRTIDHLRATGRRPAAVSLDELAERAAAGGGALPRALEVEPLDAAADVAGLERLMEAARLTVEERFSLIAGAYGLNDTESAAELGRRLERPVGAADIRRWRFRGREKLRRSAEIEER
jgi:DNA-directed RNA polymerase specialized sigma24 family protein